MTPRLILVLFAIVFAAAGSTASAHDSRPLVVKIAVERDIVRLSWRAPPSVEGPNAPVVTLAAPCVASAPPRPSMEGRAVYACPRGPTAVAVAYGLYNPSLSTVIRVEREGVAPETALLRPDQPQWTPQGEPRFASVARSYFVLGVGHIWAGLDHLLFLGGLLLLARSLPRILMTVTGFTLAHSVTLALVALGALKVSIPAVEAAIALSIVFVAAEVARGDTGTLAWRRPALIAAVFGLLHGAGFAAALGEIGLPRTERLAALLFFNVGVEAGQLVVVAAALSAFHLLRTLRAAAQRGPSPFPRPARAIAGYALGITASYWMVERILAALTPAS